MTITEHKRLVAAIPEDLKEREEIEVSDDGKAWTTVDFERYNHESCGAIWASGDAWGYARRPAAAQKTETVSELCRRTHMQNCHICDDMSCGDNMNRPAAAQKKRLKDEPWLNKFEEEEKPKEEEQK